MIKAFSGYTIVLRNPPSITALMLTFGLFITAGPCWAAVETYMEADVVIGQPDFVSDEQVTDQLHVRIPNHIFSDGKRLFVADQQGTNNRVLIWNRIPTANFAPADVVVGQPNFTSTAISNTASGVAVPRAVTTDGRRLFVSSTSQNRVLIWNSIPTTNGAPADVVIGQDDFTSVGFNTTQSTLRGPQEISTDGKRLVIADTSNHRVLIYNSIPTSNGAPADVVLGQTGFTTRTTGTSQTTMSNPSGAYLAGGKLFVSETGNNRILIWNKIPTENATPADVVIGQPSFQTGTANNGGISASTLNFPQRVASDGKILFVTDGINRRLLVWDSIPTSSFAPADRVLLQPDFGSSDASSSSRHAAGFIFGVGYDGRNIFVSDNNRILIFKVGGGQNPADLGPQFTQGKALVGKVFLDWNENGIQDPSGEWWVGSGEKEQKKHNSETPPTTHHPPLTTERGIEGVKIVSDTGIYAITDSDGMYHFPYIETGQRILKIDPITLPEGATLTTESPRKIIVTEGVLSKVSFGIKLAAGSLQPAAKDENNEKPLLKATVTQDPVLLKPKLSVKAERHPDKIVFFIETNYAQFIQEGALILYDKDLKVLDEIHLKPLPYRYELPSGKFPQEPLLYRITLKDAKGNNDESSLTIIP